MPDHNFKRECVAFCTYLTGEGPTAYVLNTYHEAASLDEQLNQIGRDAFDTYLLALSLLHPLMLKMVDTYTSLFQSGSVVRRKLVLTLALLECSAPTYLYVEGPATERRLRLLAHLLWLGLSFALALVLAVLVLVPLRALVWCRQRIASHGRPAERGVTTASAGPVVASSPAVIDS